MAGTTDDGRAALETREREQARARTCLLVIDDEPLVRGIVESTLEALGYEILVAEDGLQGLARFDEHADRIHGVILDMLMPELGGAETFARLREKRRELPVLITTGYAGTEGLAALLDQEHVRLLLKPFGQKELAAEVEQLFGLP